MSKKKSTAKANFEKTPRKDALVVAAKLSQALWPLCKIVTVVGSIRQGKEMIGDIDIVVIPRSNLPSSSNAAKVSSNTNTAVRKRSLVCLWIDQSTSSLQTKQVTVHVHIR